MDIDKNKYLRMNHCASIEPLIYLTKEELSRDEQEDLQRHLNSCGDCKRLREEILGYRDSIINEINRRPKPSTSRENRLLRWVTISSSVAAVLLLFLFTIEQARSVSRISILEESMVQTTISDPGLFIDRITLIQSNLSSEEWSNLLKGIFNDPFQLTPTLHPFRPTPNGKLYLVDITHWKGNSYSIQSRLQFLLQNGLETLINHALSPAELQQYRIPKTFIK